MKTYNFIDTVIIDTCAFQNLNYDFSGVNNTTIPSFKSLLTEHEIQLISSAIIINEIQKHVADKAQEKTTTINRLLGKNKDILPMIGIKSIASVHKRVLKLDLSTKYKKEIDDFFNNALMLRISSAEKVFERYFNTDPPFSETGDKKHEFPDAFVIESVLKYITENNKNVLVISNDKDWEEAFRNIDDAIFVRSINEAINQVQEIYTSKNIVELYSELSLEETARLLCKKIKESNFYTNDIFSDFESIEDVFITDAIHDLCPLVITNHRIRYSAIAPIEFIANLRIFDVADSIVDNEKDCPNTSKYKIEKIESKSQVYFEAEVIINEDRSVRSTGAVTLENINNNKDFKVEPPRNLHILSQDLAEAGVYVAELAPLVMRLQEQQSATAKALAPLITQMQEQQDAVAKAWAPTQTRFEEQQNAIAKALAPLITQMQEQQNALARAWAPMQDQLQKESEHINKKDEE